MLRLARVQNTLSAEQILLAQQISELLKNHTPPSVAHVLASPVLTENPNELDWLSTRTGQITPFSRLTEAAQKDLLGQIEKLQKPIQHLHQHLLKQNQPQKAALLAPLLQHPKTEHLYSIDGYPVLTHWVPDPKAQLTTPTSAVDVAAEAASPAATTVTATAQEEAVRKRPWWLWLLLLLLLFLAVLLCWYFCLRAANNVDPIPATSIKPKTYELSPSLPVTSAPTPTSSPNYACLAQKVDKPEPPEFTIILDNSGSMSFNLGVSREDELWYYETEDFSDQDKLRAIKLFSGTVRFDVAKRAMAAMLKSLHPDVSPRLMTFGSCGVVHDHGIYTKQRSTQLLNTILQLKAESATPSAQALFEAAQKMDGINKEGVIVLFIDGEDGCDQNICQVADLIAQEKPKIRANVVDISGFGLSNCVAEKTGGRIYSSADAVEITDMLQESINEVSAEPTC